MSTEILNQSTLPILEQVLSFTHSRHNVLAGNVANMDTPGYKVRDLSTTEFQTRLAEAIEAKHSDNEPISQAEVAQDPDSAMRRVKETMKDILYHDGSEMSMEKQVLEVNKNQSLHNTAVAIMTQQIRLLNVAISERV